MVSQWFPRDSDSEDSDSDDPDSDWGPDPDSEDSLPDASARIYIFDNIAGAY